MHLQTFELSDKLFQGFRRTIDVDIYGSLAEICQDMQVLLVSFLEHHNLCALRDMAAAKKFHIHTTTFDQLQNSLDIGPVWVCSC